jgi:tripeptidyl-peptidase-1
MRFAPNWPGTSRYVTSVGGTNTKTGTLGSEFAWEGSSGGFSNKFPVPDWQKDAVQAFFDREDRLPLPEDYASRLGAVGRGYPDISALGAKFKIIVSGTKFKLDGTRCSSTTVAGIIALLNEHTSKPLGFLNPLLYSDTSPFFDVVEGNNPNDDCYTEGFYATTGWDPVTGLGSINYESFKKSIELRA